MSRSHRWTLSLPINRVQYSPPKMETAAQNAAPTNIEMHSPETRGASCLPSHLPFAPPIARELCEQQESNWHRSRREVFVYALLAHQKKDSCSTRKNKTRQDPLIK